MPNTRKTEPPTEGETGGETAAETAAETEALFDIRASLQTTVPRSELGLTSG
jgi:hypothetical protein